jgi:uncharacterized integral membrane protein
MNSIAWLFKWTLKVAIFFTLFAFALNNQGDATVRFFFGHQWSAPMVLVVLVAFTAGVVIGVLAMVPRWWRHRKDSATPPNVALATAAASAPSAPGNTMPPHGI